MSLDVSNGHDFNMMTGRAVAYRGLDTHKPLVIHLSPPCRMFPHIMNLNRKYFTDEQWAREMAEAVRLLRFAIHLATVQMTQGRYFTFEHPQRASSWNDEHVRKLASHPSVTKITFDQCRFGLTAPGTMAPMQKTTHFLTNCKEVVDEFADVRCTCQVKHRTVEGRGISRHAAIYPQGSCKSMANAVQKVVQRHGGWGRRLS